LSPKSTVTVTTVCPGPSSRAAWSVPTTFIPVDVPAKMASSRALRHQTPLGWYLRSTAVVYDRV
jgi:hypothetical protein